jgi:hypothetical protein
MSLVSPRLHFVRRLSNDRLRAVEANLGNWLEVKAAHRSLLTRHWLLTIRNLTRRAFALTLNYDCYYSEADNNQTEACATIRHAPEISRIGTALFRRRKDHKVCDQITAVCHNYSLCGRRRARRILSPGAGRSDQFIVSLAPCCSWVYRNTAQPLQRFSRA